MRSDITTRAHMNLRRHNFFIEPHAVAVLKDLAAKKGVSMAELVRIAIKQLLDRELPAR